MDKLTAGPLELGIPHPVTPYPKLIINAAITGMVPTKKDTPHVPLTPDEIIRDAVACADAGASIVHVHARDAEGRATHHKEKFAEILRGIRAVRPELLLCATTSGRYNNTFETRSEVLDLEGDAKPDMASLTLSSLNFPTQASVNEPDMIEKLAKRMAERGIVPELEAFETGMIYAAKVLMRKGILKPPYYINLLLGNIYTAPGSLFDLAHMVTSLAPGMTWAAAGIGKYQQKMNYAAVLMGGHVRVGLEDNIFFDLDRKVLATNPMLVQRVANFAKEIGREVATPAETRTMLGFSEGGAATRDTAA